MVNGSTNNPGSQSGSIPTPRVITLTKKLVICFLGVALIPLAIMAAIVFRSTDVINTEKVEAYFF